MLMSSVREGRTTVKELSVSQPSLAFNIEAGVKGYMEWLMSARLTSRSKMIAEGNVYETSQLRLWGRLSARIRS